MALRESEQQRVNIPQLKQKVTLRGRASVTMSSLSISAAELLHCPSSVSFYLPAFRSNC